MTDNSLAPEPHEQRVAIRRAELSAAYIGRMINAVSVIAGIISVIVVIGVVWIALTGGVVPEVLRNWGGIILGFYFGQSINLVKDYMGILERQPK